MMRKRILIIVCSIVALFFVGIWYQGFGTQIVAALSGQLKSVSVGSASFRAEVVSSQHDLEKGLSDRRVLPAQSGMLFVFPIADTQTFWMQGMLFPIDMIWIRDGKVVGIERNVPMPRHNETPVKKTSPEPVTQVLEVRAHAADLVNIGDNIVIK